MELVKIDEFEQFPALASGDLDATLEVWPSVHPKDYKNYIEAGRRRDRRRPLGVVGQIGWFIPTYMVDGSPEPRDVGGPEGQRRVAVRHRGDRSSSGQLVDADPSFGSYDQEIADNLGLDFKVVYAGSEAAELTALTPPIARKTRSCCTSGRLTGRRQKYDLTTSNSRRSRRRARTRPPTTATKYACAYPPDALYKAFNADLQTKAPAAFAFLSAMNYTNDDQNPIALGIDQDGMTPEAAAQTVDRREPRRLAAVGRRGPRRVTGG